VKAHGLTKVSEGGGEADEGITVHRVPLERVTDFVAEKRAQGMFIDVKMLLVLAASIIG
jgi:ADP-ribose pyrophosphatase